MSNKRDLEDYFDDDDAWIFDPELSGILDHLENPPIGVSLDGPSTSHGGEMVGGSLLQFNLKEVGGRKNWKNVLSRKRYQANITQLRDPTRSDDIGEELTDALRRAIEDQIVKKPSLTPNSIVHFALQSEAFTHAFQYSTFTVREFSEGSERLNTYLGSLAQKLNSNQEFSPDDSFTMETTFI